MLLTDLEWCVVLLFMVVSDEQSRERGAAVCYKNEQISKHYLEKCDMSLASTLVYVNCEEIEI